jgi:hypothetical protein
MELSGAPSVILLLYAVQTLPSQCNPSPNPATAQPSVAESIDTDINLALLTSPYSGLGTDVHALPFQCRIVLVHGEIPLHAMTSPTAQPSVAETIDIEFNLFVVGLVTIVHALPFQCRTVPPFPIAQPSVAETIAIEFSLFVVGLVTIVHTLPFQCRILPIFPTAHKSVAETAAIEFRDS